MGRAQTNLTVLRMLAAAAVLTATAPAWPRRPSRCTRGCGYSAFDFSGMLTAFGFLGGAMALVGVGLLIGGAFLWSDRERERERILGHDRVELIVDGRGVGFRF